MIDDFINAFLRLWEKFTEIFNRMESRKIDVAAQRILRYFAQAQGKARGAVCYTEEELKSQGIVTEDEMHASLAEEALSKLCQEGKLEYSDGRYYLKGRVPPRPSL